MNTKKRIVLDLVNALCAAEHSGDLLVAEKAYSGLLSFCELHSIDFNNALAGAMKALGLTRG